MSGVWVDEKIMDKIALAMDDIGALLRKVTEQLPPGGVTVRQESSDLTMEELFVEIGECVEAIEEAVRGG